MITTTYPTCEADCSRPATHNLSGFHLCAAHYAEITELNAQLREYYPYD